ncbi:hypothetical protein CTAYLR_008991 [Chrysophaeum taylorii]|uniref:tRNA/rRNA methyltransferase SpoU type domain-containing protein n=1 Tax=Chrysophaeum taylorii TaxID=2483200 RepID=A0AAD7UR82_9STRA|nr:hypothetical protein CTAYLR_008991 [Chrysophaeum taylorii]
MSEDVVRSVDSGTLMRELARRGIDVGNEATKPRQSHEVGSLRPKTAESDARAAALDAALERLGVAGGAALLEGPPLKSYNSWVRPRDGGGGQQTTENAAHQIAFLQRHELARRETHLRNTDDAARRRATAGLEPHDIVLVLDNVRSAENVGSVFRTADAARCRELVTCGFTPNPLSTSKISKTAFGAETAVPSRHFDSTLEAVRYAKRDLDCVVWALETVDGAVAYTEAPLPSPGTKKGVALIFGNEVTGVDMSVLDHVDAVVQIPTYGTKNSINLACCAAIVTYDILRRWGTTVPLSS